MPFRTSQMIAMKTWPGYQRCFQNGSKAIWERWEFRRLGGGLGLPSSDGASMPLSEREWKFSSEENIEWESVSSLEASIVLVFVYVPPINF